METIEQSYVETYIEYLQVRAKNLRDSNAFCMAVFLNYSSDNVRALVKRIGDSRITELQDIAKEKAFAKEKARV